MNMGQKLFTALGTAVTAGSLALGALGCSEPVEERAYYRLVANVDGPVDFEVVLDVFFPEGHEVGDPVLMHRVGSSRAIGEVGTGGRAAVELLCAGCEVVLERGAACGTLETPEASARIQWSGDQLVSVPDGLPFCMTEGLAPRGVRVHGQIEASQLGAISRLVVSADALRPSSLTGATLTHDGVDIPLTYVGDWYGGALVLAAPVEPTGTFSLSLPTATTAAGEPAEVTFTAPLATSATLTDLTLETAPPEGAVATFGYPLEHRDGELILTDEGRAPRHSAFAALIALGDPGEATTVRWTARHASRSSAPTEIALYREGGMRSSTAILFVADELPIPAGEGALWIAITNTQQVLIPNDAADSEVFALESITLE